MVGQLFSIQPTMTDSPKVQDLQQLLARHARIFEEPHGLPPHHPHDYVIKLIHGSQPPNIQPYHYLYLYKDEIEKLVQEMLEVGIIHPCVSPYSSLVLLVHKKYGL